MKMAATIDAPAKCELRSVIRFLQAEGRSAAENHRRMIKVYGENFMSDGSVREWCRKFKEGRTDVHDEGGHGRKSVATVGLVERVDQVVRGKRKFTISELSEEFPEISRSALYTIVSKDLGYRKSTTNFRMPSRRISPRWQLTSLQKASRSLCHDMTNASTFLAIT